LKELFFKRKIRDKTSFAPYLGRCAYYLNCREGDGDDSYSAFEFAVRKEDQKRQERLHFKSRLAEGSGRFTAAGISVKQKGNS
jgi:hypothetical protein